MKLYDYIILGAGASGLMLAYRMAKDSFFDDKSILIIDKEKDKGNDRTWCYWENGDGEWDTVLSKSWNSIYFGSDSIQKTINIAPYRYKMIRSGNFYNLLWSTIKKSNTIKYVNASVKGFNENAIIDVVTSVGIFKGKKLLNSIPSQDFTLQEKYPVLQQHFLGWFIKTEQPIVDESVAKFMDFSIPQKQNTRFMYVLPIDKHTALFEYTLFSKTILETSEYEQAIKDYLTERQIEDYEIIEKERGSIPMTAYKFNTHNTESVLHIGTAGGWTKASTGYTFRNTTKQTKLLVEFLKTNSNLKTFKKLDKYWFYDLLFLDVLYTNNALGSELFSSLFKKAKATTILKFLDEETSLLEDLKIIASVPPWQFTKALFRRLF
ncbi:MAG: lycopene cyclase [Winogradskyella sp.]|uniref:lycopene cyclase family protein n=1 Tax=Winogradskyella sp. TaxID=1883156 RepID=UPI000F3F60E3|nr:lycopene cyclase family protein [Winogradskyella sp.]RNC80178.1 MAG: lycopene cyclase [Winogradskyella sp.]